MGGEVTGESLCQNRKCKLCLREIWCTTVYLSSLGCEIYSSEFCENAKLVCPPVRYD